MQRITMHRLAELVQLHRMELTTREVARLLQMSPNTERRYREALEAAELLRGPVDALPSLKQLQEAVQAQLPKSPTAGCESSVTPWADAISTMRDGGASPTAIFDRLRLEQKEFTGSLSAVKRMCLRMKKAKGVAPEDVAMPVETVPGDVAQVDFGSIDLRWDSDAEKGSVINSVDEGNRLKMGAWKEQPCKRQTKPLKTNRRTRHHPADGYLGGARTRQAAHEETGGAGLAGREG